MITRVFRAIVPEELHDAFEAKFRTVSVPLVRGKAGLESVTIGRPTRWNPNEEWGGEGTFLLRAGSLGETALLTSLAGGAAVDVFGFEARAEAGLDFSRFGRGMVPVQSPSPEGPFEIDLGRNTVRDVMVRVGIFRPLG